MSTATKLKAVYGYIRRNYQHSVPDVIIKICYNYFYQTIVYHIKGKQLETLFSAKNGTINLRVIQFNKDLSFTYSIAINGYNEEYKDTTTLVLAIKKISPSIEWFRICYGFQCKEIQSSVKDLNSYKHDISMHPIANIMDRAKIIKQSELTFNFMIHALVIKYKKEQQPLYYPSLKSLTLKKTVHFKWNVEKELIESFKDYTNGFRFDSPIFDHIFITCSPNGTDSTDQGTFCFCVSLAVIPLNISKGRFKFIIKTNFCEEKAEYILESTLDIEDSFVWCENNEFATDLLKDELVIDVEMNIMDLYDLNDHIIARNEWTDHNVD